MADSWQSCEGILNSSLENISQRKGALKSDRIAFSKRQEDLAGEFAKLWICWILVK
ncbi:MAG: hypothetical protein LBU32_19540 [Clostridiales bacterium]|jgi:hypothetical protein|nr:hypothetical protein [Clostridiales bacterium]